MGQRVARGEEVQLAAGAVHPDLDAIVLSCMSKDPAERPPTCAGLAARLRQTGLAESWTQDRARLWWSGPPEEAPPSEVLEDTLVMD